MLCRYCLYQTACELLKRRSLSPPAVAGPPENEWNTVYLDAALGRLRAQGHPVLDVDVARLSPYMRRHLNVHGHYSFHLPDLDNGRRSLREVPLSEGHIGRELRRRRCGQ